jgi:hypothetical protein
MKKIALALLLLPAISFAENVNFIGTQYSWMSGIANEENASGYAISYRSVMDKKISAGLSYVVIDVDNVITGAWSKREEVNASVDFAFIGSFDTGAVYMGLDTDLRDDPDRSYLTKLGVATRSGKGLDFDVNISTRHGDIGLGGSIRGPLSDTIIGWEIGFTHVLDSTTSFAGLSLAF